MFGEGKKEEIMKKFKTITALLMAVLTLSAGTIIANAGGCGTYFIYHTGTPSCRKEHCGIWDSTALVQNQKSKRKCVRKDNTTYWQYKTQNVHIDCGC